MKIFSTSRLKIDCSFAFYIFSYKILVMRKSSVQGFSLLLEYADSNYRVSNKMQSMLHGRGLIRVFRNSATF